MSREAGETKGKKRRWHRDIRGMKSTTISPTPRGGQEGKPGHVWWDVSTRWTRWSVRTVAARCGSSAWSLRAGSEGDRRCRPAGFSTILAGRRRDGSGDGVRSLPLAEGWVRPEKRGPLGETGVQGRDDALDDLRLRAATSWPDAALALLPLASGRSARSTRHRGSMTGLDLTWKSPRPGLRTRSSGATPPGDWRGARLQRPPAPRLLILPMGVS